MLIVPELGICSLLCRMLLRQCATSDLSGIATFDHVSALAELSPTSFASQNLDGGPAVLGVAHQEDNDSKDIPTEHCFNCTDSSSGTASAAGQRSWSASSPHTAPSSAYMDSILVAGFPFRISESLGATTQGCGVCFQWLGQGRCKNEAL